VIVTESPTELARFLDEARRAAKRVGFHRTARPLHGGHRANIRQMVAECDVAAVSFLGPSLRRGPDEPAPSGPGELEGDLAQAEEAGAHIVWVPRALSGDWPLKKARGRPAANDLTRPRRRAAGTGGVVSVVTSMFAITGPCAAYLGEKDYGRLVMVRRLVRELSLPVAVVSCPTIREPDGLALSSSNVHLNPSERRAAPVLYWALLAGRRAIDEHDVVDGDRARTAVLDVAAGEPLIDLEYAGVVSPETLAPVAVISGEVRLLIAGRIGRTRLVDSVAANQQEEA
jgi:pantoate--beta-alanine ligase